MFNGLAGCVWSAVVMLQTRARRRQIAAFCSNCWPQLIPKHITVPSTVQEHKVTTRCFMLRLYTVVPVFFHLNYFCTFTNLRCNEVGATCEELEVCTVYRGLHLRLKGQTSAKTQRDTLKNLNPLHTFFA
jgi:hypothetical protein